MTRTRLRKGIGPGSWRRTGSLVIVTCGQCGAVAPIDHVVDDDGNVSPSLVCPDDACNWHVWATLERWVP